ncbi:hypothetical protein ACQKOE_07185 [Novosphingobium sp. NPDC080210]|uniref:hypothetical protein n=1 Tax=Novosphingobium sp. NPDC080210 TaxID=3390596 RepID=UPI003CFE7C38
MLLTPNQLVMLADCLDAGFEACEINHVENGGTNTEADILQLTRLEDALRTLARRGVAAELKLAEKGPASLLDGGILHAEPEIEWLSPVNDEDLPPVDR